MTAATLHKSDYLGFEPQFEAEPIIRAVRGTDWRSGQLRRVRYDLTGVRVEAIRIGTDDPRWVSAINLDDFRTELLAAADAGNGVVLCLDGERRIVLLHVYAYTKAA